MQSDLVSYQRTISCIEYIIHFDTATAAVHHLKAEKVRCEQRDSAAIAAVAALGSYAAVAAVAEGLCSCCSSGFIS